MSTLRPSLVVTSRGSYFTVGVHLTPTLEPDAQDRPELEPVVTVGPLSRGVESKEDFGGEFWSRELDYFPGLEEDDLGPHQADIQTRLAGHQDQVVQFSPREPRCFNPLDIESPGLTSCLALAELTHNLLEQA